MFDLTWEAIAAADPRIAALDHAARVAAITSVAFAADRSRDDIYAEAKPYIVVLVGWRRGMDVLPKTRRPDIAERFAEVVARPAPTADPDFLHGQTAYHFVVEHIHDSICDAADRYESKDSAA